MKKLIRSFPLFVLSILIFTGSSLEISAQTNVYSIASYKNPTYRYQFLNTQFNLGSNSSNQRFGSSVKNYGLKTVSGSLNSSVNADYQLLMNTPTYQGEQNASFDFYLSGGANKADGTLNGHSRSFDQSSNLRLNSSNRYYFKPNYFLEVSPSLILSNNSFTDHYWNEASEAQTESEFKLKDAHRELQGSLGVAIGQGRIEAVQDAQMAIYILEDLNKLGSLKRNLSAEDIEALATVITKAKTTRFFDSRIQRIKEMAEIDALLGSRGLKSNGDAAYFTSLYDNWLYANNPIRESGHRYFVGLSVDTYNKNRVNSQDSLLPAGYTNKAKSTDQTYGAGVYVGFKNEKPLNLKWQRSFSGRVDFTYNFYKEASQQLLPSELNEFIIKKTNGPSLDANIGGSYGYYPTTRTYANAGLYYNMHYGKFDRESDYDLNKYTDASEFWSSLQLSLGVNYYCSERLRLHISAGEFLYLEDMFSGSSEPSGINGSHSKRLQMQTYLNATLSYSFL